MKGIRNRKNGKGCKKWKEEGIGRMGKDVRNERKKEKEEWERK